MPGAEAFLLSLIAVVILLLIVTVRRERLHPELGRSPSTRLAIGFVLAFTAWAVANIIMSAMVS
jgi:hypothetical protein